MKLFKRTSIFLSIVIVLLWIFVLVWVNYPLNNVRVTEVEKQQTRELIEKRDITVSDEILDLKIKSLEIPDVLYLAHDAKTFEDACAKGKLHKISDDSYEFDNSTVYVSGNSISIEGESKLIEKVTSETVLSKSKALIDWLKISKKNMAVYVLEKMDGFLITYVPEYKGKRIFDCKISVMLYGQSRYKVEFIPYELKKTRAKLLPKSSCAVLCELALSGNANGETIKEMNLGYKIDGDCLKPAWEIKTKNNNVFYAQ